MNQEPNDDDQLDASERFWIGPRMPKRHVVYKMQLSLTEKALLTREGDTVLDTTYSEFSVRLYNPRARTLSFINQTIAILPKSKLRKIYNLIGEYLNEHDAKESA